MITLRIEIKGYEGMYEVDRIGNVYSVDRHDGRINRKGKKLKVDINSVGYSRVTLSKDGKTKRFFVHRLVYETILGEVPNGLHIHHINELKHDNSIENLMPVTARENNHFSAKALGYKLKQEDVDYIRKNGLGTREIADKFNISLRHALRIIKNERWIS